LCCNTFLVPQVDYGYIMRGTPPHWLWCDSHIFLQEPLLRLQQHMKEINRKVPLNTKVLPTSLTKRACEEKVKSCFFDILIAQDTIIVVSFELVFLPLENIPGIESVHQQ